MDRVDRYLDEPDRPSLIHGDLWAGNYIIAKEAKPVDDNGTIPKEEQPVIETIRIID